MITSDPKKNFYVYNNHLPDD